MRTPWRFVADLVSRKPKNDTSDEARSTAGKMKTLENKAATEEQILNGEPITSAPLAYDDHNNNTGSTSSALDITPEISSASNGMLDSQDKVAQLTTAAEKQEFNAPVEETAPAASEGPQKRRPRKKPELAISSNDAVITSGMASPPEPLVPKTFIEEMAEVDAEVDGLRRQLAKKLTEQNAQLRKMIARFETR